MKSALLAALCAAPALCFAQSSPAADDAAPVMLDPVLVTASRTPQAQSQTLASTIVIDRAQIEAAQAGDVAELLRFNAGIELGRSGGSGQLTSVFIRGGESNHTLVLIDGVRVNPATSGGGALQNLSPSAIERIEIVKGPRTTLYGSDAIAGVINIITRSAGSEQIEAALRGGSYGTVDGSAGYSNSSGDYGVAIDTQQQRSDGFPACAGGPSDSGFRNNSVTAKATAKTGIARFEARAFNAQGKTETYDFCGAGGFNPTAQQFRNQALALTVRSQLLANWDSTLSFSRGEDRIRQYDSTDFVRTIRPQLDWQNTVAVLPGLRALFGGQLYQERVNAESFGTVTNQNVDVSNAFLQGQYDDDHHHLLVAGSLFNHDAFDSRLTWNAEYGYDLYRRALYKTTFIAAAGTGFRAPDASDRFGFGGTPVLAPERAQNLELGLRQRWGANQTWDLRAFRSRVRDLISVDYDAASDANGDFVDDTTGGPAFRAVNIGRTRNEGLEMTYRYADTRWSGSLTGLIQNPKDRDTDAALARRARRSVTAQLRRDLGRYYLATDLLGSSDRADFGGKNSGYTLWNLGAGVRLPQGFSLSARLENLLDRDYQTANGYQQAGRSVYGTLRWQYR